MPSRKLTDKIISNVQPPKKGRLVLADALEAALELRITQDDRRSWSVRVWTGPADKRKQRRVTLGHPRERDGFPMLTLAQARQTARDVKQAAAEGKALVPGDGLKGAQTFGELAEEYIAFVKDQRRPSTAAEIKRILHSRDLAQWRDRPAKAIGPDDMRALRDRVHERGPAMSTKVLRIISGMGNWAADEGKLPASPASGVRQRSPDKARDRVLSDAEIATLWRACDALPYPFAQVPKLLLLTAARLREVGQMEWAELNLDYRVWHIPAKRCKNNKAHTLHLSAPAAAILRELAEQRKKVPALARSPYVFVSAKGEKIASFSHAKERLDDAIAMELEAPLDFRFHDLRRTSASTMARLKHAPHIVERILNHTKGEMSPVARVYNLHNYADECADALEALGRFVTALAEPRVVPLRRA